MRNCGAHIRFLRPGVVRPASPGPVSAAQGAAGGLGDLFDDLGARPPRSRHRSGSCRSVAGARSGRWISCPAPICASALSPVNWSNTRTLSISALSAPCAALTAVSASTLASTTKAKSRSTACRSRQLSAGRVGVFTLGSGHGGDAHGEGHGRALHVQRVPGSRGCTSPKVASTFGPRPITPDRPGCHQSGDLAGDLHAGGGAERRQHRLGIGLGVVDIDRAARAVRVARRRRRRPAGRWPAGAARPVRRRGRRGRPRTAPDRRSRAPDCGRRRAAGRAAGRGADGSFRTRSGFRSARHRSPPPNRVAAGASMKL